MRPDYAIEVRRGLTDPRKLCERLGLLKGAKPQAGGVSICCPSHAERNPSCSVTNGPDGTVRVRCFGCDFAGDGLTLIAQVYGLSLTADFRDVLALGAELGGQLPLAEEIRSGQPKTERRPLPAPEPEPERDYPPTDEVFRFWRSCVAVCSDADAWEHLRGRAIDPESIDVLSLARVVAPGTKAPPWARYGRRSWLETDHRLIVPMFDAAGQLRSVRGWRLSDGDSPKRLPPVGHKATGIVMANALARKMLTGRASPLLLTVVEGEPDFLTAATAYDCAVIGIISGSWTDDIARRVPGGTEVMIATHLDDAGERYADAIASTIWNRCPVRRIAA